MDKTEKTLVVGALILGAAYYYMGADEKKEGEKPAPVKESPKPKASAKSEETPEQKSEKAAGWWKKLWSEGE